MLCKVVLTFESVNEILNPILLSSTFMWRLFIMPYKVVLTFEPVDEILKCDNSYKSYLALLSWVTAVRFKIFLSEVLQKIRQTSLLTVLDVFVGVKKVESSRDRLKSQNDIFGTVCTVVYRKTNKSYQKV